MEKDICPLIQEGFESARNRGYLAVSGDLNDSFVSGMNMGWEVPGTFDVEMEVRNLRVKAAFK